MIALDTVALGIRRRSVQQIMTQVMLALVPGTIVYASLIDSRMIMLVIVACLTALCCEAACLRLRRRPLKTSLGDGSVLLASWLLALCVPPSLPVWQLLVGVIIMVTLGKHVFGGLGHNPFNPAMVAYTILLVSFPVTMTQWDIGEGALFDWHYSSSSDSNLEVLATEWPDANQASIGWDGISGATVLDRLRETRQEFKAASTTLQERSDAQPPLPDHSSANSKVLSTPWIWVSMSWLIGGLYLLWIRIISWHIPVSILLTVVVLYAATGMNSGSISLSGLPALLSGAIMLGAFFIATDPVSAAASRAGQLLYGSGIGLFTFLIREYSAYPEGVAFAVLLMNLCVPLIDRLSTGDKGNLTINGPLR